MGGVGVGDRIGVLVSGRGSRTRIRSEVGRGELRLIPYLVIQTRGRLVDGCDNVVSHDVLVASINPGG